MKKFINIHNAIKYAKNEETVIPSGFMAAIPNCLGINLCAVNGFIVDVQEDGQLKSLEISFCPTNEPLQQDHSWLLKALEEQGTDI